MRPVRLAPLLALTLLGALAGSASAATFCVSDPACVSAGGIPGSDLQAALDAAVAGLGPDTVKIGPGTFSAADGFTAGDGTSAITVIGAGRGLTTLAATSANRTVLAFGVGNGPGHDASVSDLTIAMPPSGGWGVDVPQHIARVTVSGGTGAAMGVRTQNTSVDDVTIALPLDGSANTGVYRPNGTLTADGLTVTAHKAIDGGGGTDAYRHLRVMSDGTGISLESSFSNTMTIDDAQIRMTGSGQGIAFTAQSGTPAFLRARFLTIRGDGTRGSVGVASSGGGAGASVGVTLEDSIVTGFDHALACFDGAAPARLAVRWSAFDPGDLVDGCAARIDARTGNLAAEPPLQAAANGDLLLPAGSPAIDAGDPSLTTLVPETDLAGAARLFDGDGDGAARVDMGAFEWAPPPIVLPPPLTGGDVGRLRGGKPAPVAVRGFSIAPRRFAPLLARPLARARARRGSSSAPHRGATFTYVLSAPAAVTIVVEQALRGHRSGRGGACRVGRGRGPPCTRWTRRTTLRQIASDAVRRSIAFSGRVGRRALPAGGYRATIVAHVDGAPDSQPRSVRFTLLS